MRSLQLPLNEEIVKTLKAGDQVLLNGTVYTARDAAHQRIIESLHKGETLPFEIQDSVIYYVGPAPAKEGQVIGSAGPTTSYRMDDFTPELLEIGLKGMIGKGKRSEAVRESIVKNKAVYFGAVGGAAALLADCIKEAKVIAYEDLGPEAIRKLQIESFPVTVVIDSDGKNLYESEQEKYKKNL